MNVNLSQGLVVGPEASKFSIPDGPFPVWLKVVGSDTGGALFAQTGIMTPGILKPPHTLSAAELHVA